MKTSPFSIRFALAFTGAAVPIALLGTACLSRVTAQEAAAETAGKSKQFKNIKVLKNLPANKLIPTMHEWNSSLGVRCDFCHIVGANHTGFDKDDKPMKNVARSMVSMLTDMNKHQKPLRGEGTCNMCHHGHPEPEMKPASDGPPPGGPPYPGGPPPGGP